MGRSSAFFALGFLGSLWRIAGRRSDADAQDARPHLLVLTGPPNAQVLVLAYVPSTSSIVVTSAVTLNPSTPSLRQAEFYRGIVAEGHIALVSLWVGVITCIELEVEKDKDLKRRRSSAVAAPVDTLPEKRLRAKEPFNVK
jgi:DNA damage-binding protein 1